MKLLRFVTVLPFLSPVLGFAATPAPASVVQPAVIVRVLKIDRARSFVDVDVSVLLHSFVAHLDGWDANFGFDSSGKVRTGMFKFKFASLKTGNVERDAAMMKWIGGENPEGLFQLGAIAVAPDGQGVLNGSLTYHDQTQRIEFPVQFTKENGVYTLIGEVTLDYTEWGLKRPRWALKKISPEVRVRVKIVGETVEPPPAPPAAEKS